MQVLTNIMKVIIFKIYKCIKSTFCIPQTYTMAPRQLYLNKTDGEKLGGVQWELGSS